MYVALVLRHARAKHRAIDISNHFILTELPRNFYAVLVASNGVMHNGLPLSVVDDEDAPMAAPKQIPRAVASQGEAL